MLFGVLIYFDDTLLDRSDDSEDVIVVTEERVKGVGKPHIQVSPAQVCVGIYLHWIKSIFSNVHDSYGQPWVCCLRKLIEIVSAGWPSW